MHIVLLVIAVLGELKTYVPYPCIPSLYFHPSGLTPLRWLLLLKPTRLHISPPHSHRLCLQVETISDDWESASDANLPVPAPAAVLPAPDAVPEGGGIK